MDAQEFFDYISKSKAKNTAKSYRNGIRHFCNWYKGDFNNDVSNKILEERKCMHHVEPFLKFCVCARKVLNGEMPS